MKKLWIAFFILLLPYLALADFTAYVYMLPYATTKTVEWQYPEIPLGIPDGYEFHVYQIESGKILAKGITSTASVTIKFKTHGHNEIRVRSIHTIAGVKQYGPWASSINIGIISGKQQGWVIFVMNP